MWKRRHLYEKAAACYDTFIRSLVPVFDTMQEHVVETVREVLRPRAPLRAVELGVGTGILAFRLLSALPIKSYTGYETSDRLALLAQSRLSVFRGKVTISTEDFRYVRWPARTDAVLSTLTLHYLSNKDKRTVFINCFQALKPGGLVVIGDRIISRNTVMAKVYGTRMARFWDTTTKNWLPERRKEHKTQDNPAEEPWYLEDQMRWLGEVGFSEVECVWKDFNYCVFCAVKPKTNHMERR